MKVRADVADYDDPDAPGETEVGDRLTDLAFWVRVWYPDPSNNGSTTYELTECNVQQALQWGAGHAAGGHFQVGLFVPGPSEQVTWLYGHNPFREYYNDPHDAAFTSWLKPQ